MDYTPLFIIFKNNKDLQSLLCGVYLFPLTAHLASLNTVNYRIIVNDFL